MIFYNKYKKFRIENNIDLKDISNKIVDSVEQKTGAKLRS